MFHHKLTASYSVVLISLMMPTVNAQDWAQNQYGPGTMPAPGQMPQQGSWPAQPGMMPAPGSYYQPVSAQSPTQPPTPIDADQAGGAAQSVPWPQQQQGYVQLGAPMYPTPRPNIPIWSGSAVITNQAFAPHEMLYAHTYRSIYPPFYHRVKGGWVVTPFGVRSHERWELQGTQVQVKYRSSYPGLFSGAAWHPPGTSNGFGSWR